MIRCPSCQALNDDSAVICTMCNRRLSSVRTEADRIDARRDEAAEPGPDAEPEPLSEVEARQEPGQPIDEDGATEPEGPGSRLSGPERSAIDGDTDRTSSEAEQSSTPTGTSGDSGTADAEPTGTTAASTTGADTSAYGEAARRMLLEQLADDVPTIGVIGNFNVGKTFFISQVIATAKDKGYSHTPHELQPGRSEARETEVVTSADPDKLKKRVMKKIREHLPITVTVWVHKFERDTKPFRIIDMPGEFFLAALDDPQALRAKANPRIAMLFPALASSDALILIVPAHHAFGGSEKDKLDAERAVHLLGNIRQVANLLEQAETEQATVEAAVTEVLNLTPEDFQRETAKGSRGKSRKPITVLFSQADKCFDIGDKRNPMGKNGQLPEHDPFLCAARDLPGVVNHLREGFEDFRVDFLTAAEGQKGPYLKVKTPSIGVWTPIVTLLDRIERAKGLHSQGWLGRMLRKAFMLDMLKDCERTSGWAIDIRAAADSEFGEALNG